MSAGERHASRRTAPNVGFGRPPRGPSRWRSDDTGHVPRAPGDGGWPPTATGTATGVAGRYRPPRGAGLGRGGAARRAGEPGRPVGPPGRRRARRLDQRRAPHVRRVRRPGPVGPRRGAPGRGARATRARVGVAARHRGDRQRPAASRRRLARPLRVAAAPHRAGGARRRPRPGPAPVCLKWPNDLLLGAAQRKAGGILAEATSGPDGTAVVLGIGLNVAGTPAELPAGATSLAAEGAEAVDRTKVLVTVLTRLAERESAWRAALGDPDAHHLRARLPRGLRQPRCRGAGGAARRDDRDGHGRRRRRRRPAAAARCRRPAPGDRGGRRRAPAARGRSDRRRADR